jgi:hypothetical protein
MMAYSASAGLSMSAEAENRWVVIGVLLKRVTSLSDIDYKFLVQRGLNDAWFVATA